MITDDSRERQVHDVGQGDHLCLAFVDDAEQRRVVTSYVSAGLARGERVLYFADRNAPATVLGWLRTAGLEPDRAVARGQLQVDTVEDSYLATGRFDPETMVNTLRRHVSDSLAAGYAGLRISGEMSWSLRDVPGAEHVHEYETEINAVFAGNRASAICQYDARRFAPSELDAFDRIHPATVELSPLYQDSILSIVPAFRRGERALRLIGSVDYRGTGHLTAALEQALHWSGDVWADMSALEFIDLAGLRALVHTAEQLPNGRRLRIVHLAPMLAKVISTVGWDEHPALVIDTQGVSA
ncbi:MEDS domain-containing protein [Streptomyces rishiriensis]|uniref:Anti-anti-sigma regulatory factor n=1 Tax=Streptomyces rishiriensis TaxID=68264 RepID=A0ABU0P275_STRRH|nr:MEDS domain-containing protein [Streptomyces rishiriensis]MDQ0585495.1 anti-anti-sigma regulatory factor [Streptomyces rishiriensis]